MVKGFKLGGSFPKKRCLKTPSPDGQHEVQFDYGNPEFEDDLVHLLGNCINCGLEFQKTYQQTEGLSVIARSTRNVFDYNHDIIETFGNPVLHIPASKMAVVNIPKDRVC